MQGPDKNTFDVSDKIVVFIKRLSLWKEDVTNVSVVRSVLRLFEQKYKSNKASESFLSCFHQLYI